MDTILKKILFTLVILFFASHSTFSAYAGSGINKLGFDPRLSAIPAASKTKKTPVITVLGFPDPEDMYRDKFDTDTTFTVTFRFHNTCLRSYFYENNYNPINYIKALYSINIGQEPDALVLLWVVAECFRKGHPKVHIFGNSRGGGTIIKLLDMLSNPQNYSTAWSIVGITNPTEQAALKNIVASGALYLAHPLMDYTSAIKLTAERIVHPLVKLTRWGLFPAGAFGVMLASMCNRVAFAGIRSVVYYSLLLALNIASTYSLASANPIALLEKHIDTANWPYHITIGLAEKDIFVGKNHEELLYKLAKKQPKKLSILDGGPNHFSIRSCIKQFHATIRNLTPINNTPSF